MTVYAWHGCSDDEYTMFLNKALDHMPDIIIDDGGDLVHLLHTTRVDARKNLIGGSEETTTGVYRLKILEKNKELQFPMIAVNDSYCKYLLITVTAPVSPLGMALSEAPTSPSPVKRWW